MVSPKARRFSSGSMRSESPRLSSISPRMDSTRSFETAPHIVLEETQPFQFDQDIDISPVHLIKIFNMMSKGRKSVSREALIDGLTSMWGHQTGFTASGLLDLIRFLDKEEAGVVSQQAFVHGIQNYVAATASADAILEEGYLIDYSPSNLIKHRIVLDHEFGALSIKEVLANPRPKDGMLRWLHIGGDDLQGVVLRLANQYALTQLQTERVLEFIHEPSIKVFSNHMHIICDTIDVKTHSSNQDMLEVGIEKISIFYIFADNTVLTLTKPGLPLTEILLDRICLENSKIRLNSSLYFIYAILDSIIDRSFSIISMLEHKLEYFQRLLDNKEQIGLGVIKALGVTQRALDKLETWFLPMVSLIRRLAVELKEKWRNADTDSIMWHLGDLVEHVMTQKVLVNHLSKSCKTLNQVFYNQQQNQINRASYLLTYISSLFLPASFLATVWGMNFDYMPELNLKYGYLIFWGVAIVFTLLIMYLVRRQQINFL